MGTTLFSFGIGSRTLMLLLSTHSWRPFYQCYTAAPDATSFDAGTSTDPLLLYDADIETSTPDTPLAQNTVNYIVVSANTMGAFLPTKAFLGAFDTNRMDVFDGEIA
jgi:hypothetical protein